MTTGICQSQPAFDDQELQCLALTALGKTTLEIAGELGLSLDDVEARLNSVQVKLRTENRMSAILKATRLGLIG